jgi:hypothetical protein
MLAAHLFAKQPMARWKRRSVILTNRVSVSRTELDITDAQVKGHA